MARAITDMNTMIASLPQGAQIPRLSPTELENMALVIYRLGDQGASTWYYRTTHIQGHLYDWARNDATTAKEGVQYVTDVRRFCGCASATPVP
jgi:hypothetical protein